ncbi:MAG: UvrD-helicase domain-containing protein [Steroidobacteraceae bacterium]
MRAVSHRGSALQIIAAAGSGKTEVVSQRVAALLAAGVDPGSIVAFTFTERAARELKRRTELRVGSSGARSPISPASPGARRRMGREARSHWIPSAGTTPSRSSWTAAERPGCAGGSNPGSARSPPRADRPTSSAPITIFWATVGWPTGI